MVFDAQGVDMILSLHDNNSYSNMINGYPYGFFYSTKGVKYGDPSLPTLFILYAKVLARALNSLFDINEFKSFWMPNWSDNINHFPYANNSILFASTARKSFKLVM